MSVKYEDYYKTLGVSRTATAEEIQQAFRRLARKYHPDVNKEKSAEGKFKLINEAYEVLKDAEKRKRYDALGENWKAGQDFRPPPGWEGGRAGAGRRSGNANVDDIGGFSDFFDSIFGAGGFGQGGGSSWSSSTRGQRLQAPFQGGAGGGSRSGYHHLAGRCLPWDHPAHRSSVRRAG